MDYKHLFYDQNEANQFSQREIIGLIRNALCHNNTNNYKVMLDDDNSIFLEIDMMTKDLKRFHVRLYDIAIMSMIIELNNTDSLNVVLFSFLLFIIYTYLSLYLKVLFNFSLLGIEDIYLAILSSLIPINFKTA